MSPDDTTPPEMAITQADTLDPGPPERCLFIKLPLLADVPLEVTNDPDQIEGLCALLRTTAQDFLRTFATIRGTLFDADGVQVAYDPGTAPDFVAFHSEES